MTATHPQQSSVRFPVQPRLLPEAKAARWLHLTVPQFRQAMPALRRQGFPLPCSITGHYDLIAMQAWQDRRSGINNASPSAAEEKAAMKARLATLG